MNTILLIGNFGVGNLGDEALKEYFLSRFPGVRWRVLSAHPVAGELSRLPAGICSLLSFRWLRTLYVYATCDGVVFGGGSLFTDTESVRACFLWWLHACAARIFRRPRYFAFQGVGPFRTRVGEWLTRSAFTGAASISVRDSLSQKRVELFKLNTKVIQTFDPVFSLLENKKHDNRTQKIFGVIPRKNSDATLRKRLAECMRNTPFDKVVILSLQPHDSREASYCSDLARDISAEVISIRTLHALGYEVGCCSYIVTQRYHGAIAALALDIPFETVMQTEGDKLSTVTPCLGSVCAMFVEAGERALRDCLS
ncbi:polysaccharide pyruvyl transferase family protein [Candidatus Peregrinibacteria bacterium]|nr:polysaccharide pyruvyl transferase family protein [Candidatus Peregrinibacteria bacterium]